MSTTTDGLPESPSEARCPSEALARRFDVALLDLDGVVYVGAAAVPQAAQSLATARKSGMRLAFVTNNASRTPEVVAAHLSELGIPAAPAEVTTSAMAAAGFLAQQYQPGNRILVVGTQALEQALQARGLSAVRSADDDPVAVVQGYSPTTDWAILAEAAIAITHGAQWVATNLDATLPSARGPLPGNGSLVAALAFATGATARATGKPDPTMHRESLERSGAKNPIVVGDRLDTDIEGAAAVGCPSLLVLSGVTDPASLLQARPEQRPDFLGKDVGALLLCHPSLSQYQDPRGGWEARYVVGSDPELILRQHPGSPPGVGDDLDALRCLCAQLWKQDEHDHAPRLGVDDDQSAAELRRLGLIKL